MVAVIGNRADLETEMVSVSLSSRSPVPAHWPGGVPVQTRSWRACSLITARATGRTAEFFDETRGFQFVQSFNRFTETILSQSLNLLLLEILFLNNFEDQVALLGGAGPVLVATIVVIFVAIASRQEPRLPEGGIHRLLEQGIEPCAFALHVGQISDLDAQREAKLMAAVVGQTDPLLVTAFECDHCFPFDWCLVFAEMETSGIWTVAIA